MSPTTYRYGGLRWWILLAAGVPGLGFVVMAVIGGTVTAVTVLGVLLLAATAAAWRARVVADRGGLAIVSPLSSRRVAWDDIRAIEVVRDGPVAYPVHVRTTDGETIVCFGLTAIRTWPVNLTGLEQIVAELEQYRRRLRS